VSAEPYRAVLEKIMIPELGHETPKAQPGLK
jgi:hypothetical protein